MILDTNCLKPILARAVVRINAVTGGYLRGGEGERLDSVMGFMGAQRDRIIKLLEDYRDRMDRGWEGDRNTRQESLVLGCFSDGATVLWDLFNRGRIQQALEARRGPHAGQPYKISYLVMVDLVRLHTAGLDWIGENFNEAGRVLPLEDGGVIRAGCNYYQQDPGAWKGTAVFTQSVNGEPQPHPRIRSELVPNASHSGSVLPDRMAILEIPEVQVGVESAVVDGYLAALERSK